MFRGRPDIRADAQGAVIGGVLGAFLGAVATSALWVLVWRIKGDPMLGIMAIFVFPVAFLGWGFGLVVLGTPGVLALHRLGARGAPATAALGAALVFACVWLALRPSVQVPAWISPVGMALAGALVGWLINVSLYRPVKP